MFSFIKKILGMGTSIDVKELLSRGAVILDVRSEGEYQGGHIKGAINIPVQVLEQRLSKVPKDVPIITCCASGMRSASAEGILKSRGYKEVYNGGGWAGLQRMMS